jgi:hypothetical protein
MSKVQVRVGQIWADTYERYKITSIKPRRDCYQAYAMRIFQYGLESERGFGYLNEDYSPDNWDRCWFLEQDVVFNKDQVCDLCKKPSPHAEPNAKDNKYICIGCATELELNEHSSHRRC